MLKCREIACCREYLLLCCTGVFGFRNETDAVVDFSFMEIIFVKGLQLTEIVLSRGSAYGDCFVKRFVRLCQDVLLGRAIVVSG